MSFRILKLIFFYTHLKLAEPLFCLEIEFSLCKAKRTQQERLIPNRSLEVYNSVIRFVKT